MNRAREILAKGQYLKFKAETKANSYPTYSSTVLASTRQVVGWRMPAHILWYRSLWHYLSIHVKMKRFSVFHKQNWCHSFKIASTTERLVSLYRTSRLPDTKSLASSSLCLWKEVPLEQSNTRKLVDKEPTKCPVSQPQQEKRTATQSLFRRALLSSKQTKECLISCSTHYSCINKGLERYSSIAHWHRISKTPFSPMNSN